MNRMRIAVVGLALFAAACSDGGVSGRARPASVRTPVTSEVSRTSGAGLAGVKPCELISGAEAAGLGLVAPRPRTTAGLQTCEWDGSGNGGLTVAVDVRRGADALDYAGDAKTPARFGERDGFSVAAPDGEKDLCHAVISVSASSSVQLVASAGGASADTAKACALATRSAELVAARLP
ncbi:DUF3558 family protein [Lentzea sp. NPDC042327]|uniref:DUF3558 family protein n=1 Tax=Lentzea sp. NPDC042327 TaxID=3154801 RepID=UPI00340FAA69